MSGQQDDICQGEQSNIFMNRDLHNPPTILFN